MLKRFFFFYFSFIWSTAHASCKASSELELPLWALVPWGATFHPEPSAERCKSCYGAIPAEFQLLEKLHEWCHFLCFADWSFWQGTRHGHHGKVGFLPCITFMHWSGWNLDASCVFSVMRDFCKSPPNFCSFNNWKIIYLVFSNLPSCSFFPRLDCIFVQSSLLCRLLDVLVSINWEILGVL